MTNGLHRSSDRLQNYLDRIEDMEGKNKETILKFKDKCFSQGNLSDTRVVFYFSHLLKLLNWIDKPLIELNKEELEKLVAELNQKDYSAWTKQGYKTTIKKFFQVLEGYNWGSKEYPDKVDWINPYIKKSNRKKIKREDIISQDEAHKLISKIEKKRNKAMFYLLWEGGLRAGEILNMKVKHIEINDKANEVHAIIPEEGKTGTRRILIVSSVPSIREWLRIHPHGDDREGWLWEKERSEDRISYGMLRKLSRKYGKKAEVEKPMNPHNWRHSRVTFCLGYMTDAEARKFFGWAKDSNVLSRYDHLVDRDVDRAVRNMYGEQEKEIQRPKKPKTCRICGYENSPDRDICEKCKNPLYESKFPPWIEKLINKRMEELKGEMKEELKVDG